LIIKISLSLPTFLLHIVTFLTKKLIFLKIQPTPCRPHLFHRRAAAHLHRILPQPVPQPVQPARHHHILPLPVPQPVPPARHRHIRPPSVPPAQSDFVCQ
jgi:hypothetical protein